MIVPFNGSGIFSLVAGNPVVTGTTISSTWANNTLSDMANNGLTNCLTKDGQQTPTANLPMGGFRHTGVSNAQNLTDYAAAGQVQNGTFTTLGSVSGTDTITATVPALTSYSTGQVFRGIAVGSNTTTSVTLNINGIGAKNVKKAGTNSLAAGDIVSAFEVIYDGTEFQLLSVNTLAMNLSTLVLSVPGATNPVLTIEAPNATLTGANILLSGNGTTTPNKSIRAYNGQFQIVNNLYNAIPLTLDDAGDLSITGSFSAAGTVTGSNLTASSDERLKEDWQPMTRDFLERMAGVLHGTFAWKADGVRSAGVGAASLQEAFPEVVHEDARGMLSAAYGQAALVTVLELIPIVLRLLDQSGEAP